MEDSVCPSGLGARGVAKTPAASAHLLGSLLDGFLETAMDRVAEGAEEALFAEAVGSKDPRLSSLHLLADQVVDLLEDQLTGTAEDARECIESLERARKDPLLRDLVVPEWDKYFRTSVSPKKIFDELMERHRSGLSTAESEAQRDQAVSSLAQSAVFLTSLTSQLKTHLEKVFARDPLLAWMSGWTNNNDQPRR